MLRQGLFAIRTETELPEFGVEREEMFVDESGDCTHDFGLIRRRDCGTVVVGGPASVVQPFQRLDRVVLEWDLPFREFIG